jgi:hypothetical protein
MRPLKINPGHAITELALSPDGQRLGVVQSTHGFRLFDALTGAELGRDTHHAGVTEISPTGRQSMHASRAEIRLAEATSGRQFLRFQTGWTRPKRLNLPPVVLATSGLRSAMSIGSVINDDLPGSIAQPRPGHWVFLTDCALTTDHRFAVGRLRGTRTESRCQVWNLATETVLAEFEGIPHEVWPSPQTVFSPDGTRALVATPRDLMVFDLPLSVRGVPLADPMPRTVLVPPAVTISFTRSQPESGIPPFAVFPCGRKALVRGEKSRVELRDLSTGEVLTVWKWGMRRVQALAVAGDGLTAAAAGAGGEVVMWDLG